METCPSASVPPCIPPTDVMPKSCWRLQADAYIKTERDANGVSATGWLVDPERKTVGIGQLAIVRFHRHNKHRCNGRAGIRINVQAGYDMGLSARRAR